MRLVALILLALALAGCPTREFYLQEAEVAWQEAGITRVAVPAFEATPAAWMVADRARRAVVEALDRGTVRVVEEGGQATLEGAVVQFREGTNPGAPRRVQRTSNSLDPYALSWEMDVTHLVEFRLAMRLVVEGRVLWSKESHGSATESQSVPINWPGSDPLPPPAVMPHPIDPRAYDHLRERALEEALRPLLEALAVQYRYRSL